MSEIFVDDFGTVLQATLGADITGQTEIRIDITKPDESTNERVATVVDLLTGVIKYTTIAEDFDTVGNYCLVPFVKFGANAEFRGKATKFTVKDPCT